MRVGIMQPYFLPYIGYFQLISAVDVFVVYDNVKYTKKGWINRNRFLQNGRDATFTLPLKSDSDALDVRDRSISDSFDKDRLLRQLGNAYRRAPQFARVVPLLESIVRFEEANLFRYIDNSIRLVCQFLGVPTRMMSSSDIPIDHTLKGQARVLAICGALGATRYVNAIGGVGLYSADAFKARDIELRFIRSAPIEYPQLGQAFVPWLSIVDVLSFNSLERSRELLGAYQLVPG